MFLVEDIMINLGWNSGLSSVNNPFGLIRRLPELGTFTNLPKHVVTRFIIRHFLDPLGFSLLCGLENRLG